MLPNVRASRPTGRHRRPPWAVLILFLIALGFGTLVNACSSARASCAGQCKAPYRLVINFKTSVTPSTAAATVRRCAQDPDVVRIGSISSRDGELVGSVYTRHFLLGPRTKVLFACFEHDATVQSAGWPD